MYTGNWLSLEARMVDCFTNTRNMKCQLWHFYTKSRYWLQLIVNLRSRFQSKKLGPPTLQQTRPTIGYLSYYNWNNLYTSLRVCWSHMVTSYFHHLRLCSVSKNFFLYICWYRGRCFISQPISGRDNFRFISEWEMSFRCSCSKHRWLCTILTDNRQDYCFNQQHLLA